MSVKISYHSTEIIICCTQWPSLVRISYLQNAIMRSMTRSCWQSSVALKINSQIWRVLKFSQRSLQIIKRGSTLWKVKSWSEDRLIKWKSSLSSTSRFNTKLTLRMQRQMLWADCLALYLWTIMILRSCINITFFWQSTD